MSIISGACIGQPHEPSAFAVLERSGSGNDAHYQLRDLQRFRAGTPYPDMFDKLEGWYRDKKNGLHGTTLVVDKTGIGQGIVDLLQRRQIGAHLQCVQIIHGHHAAETEEGFAVPKKDAAAALQSVLSTRRIAIPTALLPGPLWSLRTELASFRLKNTTTLGGDPMEPHRDSDQADLIYAVCLPIWYSDRIWGPSWIPSNNPSQQSQIHKMLYEEGIGLNGDHTLRGSGGRRLHPGEERFRPA
jgi:hypothetical protein